MIGYTPPQGLTDAENFPKESRIPSWMTKDDVPEGSTRRKGLTKAASFHKTSRMFKSRTKDKGNVSRKTVYFLVTLYVTRENSFIFSFNININVTFQCKKTKRII